MKKNKHCHCSCLFFFVSPRTPQHLERISLVWHVMCCWPATDCCHICTLCLHRHTPQEVLWPGHFSMSELFVLENYKCNFWCSESLKQPFLVQITSLITTMYCFDWSLMCMNKRLWYFLGMKDPQNFLASVSSAILTQSAVNGLSWNGNRTTR